MNDKTCLSIDIMRQKDEGFIATSRPFIIIGPHSLPGKNKLSTTIKYFLYVFKLNLGRGRNKIFMVGNSVDNFTKLPCFYRTFNNVLSILIKFVDTGIPHPVQIFNNNCQSSHTTVQFFVGVSIIALNSNNVVYILFKTLHRAVERRLYLGETMSPFRFPSNLYIIYWLPAGRPLHHKATG